MAESFDPYYQWLGIPPEEQPPNHYQLLGIKWFEDNTDVISAAVDRQVLHLRTYQIGEHSDTSQKLLSEVISAKLCLLDPAKKAVYDQQLLEGDLEKSIETQKASKSAAFGPQLEALFDESEQVESGKLHKMPKKRRKFPKKLVAGLIALGVGLALICVVIMAASWLIHSVADRLGGGVEPAPASVQDETLQDAADATAEKTPADELPDGDRARTSPEEPEEGVDQEPKPSLEKSAPADSSTSGWPKDAKPPVVSPASSRLAVPTPQERDQARERLESQYPLYENSTPIGKIRLAKKLLRSKRGLAAGPGGAAVRYEMLEQASRLAAESGSYALSLAIVDEIGSQFDIDTLDVKQQRFLDAALTANDPAKLHQLSIAADKFVEEAIEQKRFETAMQIVETMIGACKHPGGREYRKTFVERRKEIIGLEKRSEDIEAAENILKESPDDAAANLALGKHYCFDRGDWQRGIPYLAKGDDEGLVKTAQFELDKTAIDNLPLTADDEVELGDAWWKLAATKPGPMKKPILRRAAYWYKRSQPRLSDVKQTKHVAKRLEAIRRLALMK